MARLRFALDAAPWRSAAYLLGSIVVSTVLFVVVLTSIVLAGSLVVIGIGLPLLVAAAAIVRAAAHVERQRAALVPGVDVDPSPSDPSTGDSERLHTAPIASEAVAPSAAVRSASDLGSAVRRPASDGAELPRPAHGRGLLAAVRRGWRDPAMAPSLGYLLGLYVPLLLLDAIAVGVWLSFLGGVTVPLWYWAVPQTFDGVTHHGLFWGWFPDGPGADGAIGLAVDDLPSALAFAGVSAVLFALVACPLVVAAARIHARIAGRLLGPPVDPLAEAKAVLRSPGPLALDPAAAPPPAAAGRGRPRAHLHPLHLTVTPPRLTVTPSRPDVT